MSFLSNSLPLQAQIIPITVTTFLSNTPMLKTLLTKHFGFSISRFLSLLIYFLSMQSVFTSMYWVKRKKNRKKNLERKLIDLLMKNSKLIWVRIRWNILWIDLFRNEVQKIIFTIYFLMMHSTFSIKKS